MAIIWPFLVCCQSPASVPPSRWHQGSQNPYRRIADIPPPDGFSRIPLANGQFGAWLRQFPLRANRTIFLHTGQPKPVQAWGFAVLDLPLVKGDLQQCADAILRLRAMWLLEQGPASRLVFPATNGDSIRYSIFDHGGHYRLRDNHLSPVRAAQRRTNDRARPAFDVFMETVCRYCGTISLDRQLRFPVARETVMPGDVLISPGSPGHAMIVMDVAINPQGVKMALLAQSYMPAQDMHLVVDPAGKSGSPWFIIAKDRPLRTAEWDFQANRLKTW